MRLKGWVALVAAVVELAAPARADTEWKWFQGDPPRVMEPVATSVCLLVRIAGRFSGDGELVRVSDDGKNWILSGHSANVGISAFARCVPLARFKAAGTARWHQDFTQDWQGSSPGSCVQNPAEAWWGDAATFVSGMGGQYRGAGEYIEVQPSADAKAPTQWVSQTCRDAGRIIASVTSLFVGTPHAGKLVRMVGPDGTGTAAQAGEWRIGPNSHVPLAKSADALCGLSYVAGSFLSAGESIYLYQYGDHWMLGTVSQSGTGTRAGVRCIAYQQ